MKKKDLKINIRFIMILITLLYTSQLSADSKTVYENAEDRSNSRWSIYGKNLTGATVKNIYNINKGSRVIQFKNNASSIYKIGRSAWNNTKNNQVTWSMSFNSSFVIYIFIKTKYGVRKMYYTKDSADKGINGIFIHHGLGKSASNGAWQTFTRNIEDDLHAVEPNNELISTNYFMVLGDGFIDDL